MIEVPATAPMPWLMLRVGEPVTAQLNVLDCPGVIVAGDPQKLVMVGELPAVTVTDAVAEPKAFVAVSVYAVVAEGVTTTDVPLTAPTVGLMDRLVAPVTAQVSVLGLPAITAAGAAEKLVMTGGLPTPTVAEAVTEPNVFVAVSV